MVKQKTSKVMSNTNKATGVGIAAGGGGAVVITWLASELERHYSIPPAVSAVVLGTLAGFLTRWAAKLLPDA